jgi:hypothetical protein
VPEGDAKEASRQLCKEFDQSEIGDDLVQVMSVRECRLEYARRMGEGGVHVRSGYSKGDIYGALVPVHVWFVIGFEKVGPILLTICC